MFWTSKCLWAQNVFVTQNILDPKFFRTPDSMDQKFYWFKKISEAKLKTFAWESSVALLSPTCYYYYLKKMFPFVAVWYLFFFKLCNAVIIKYMCTLSVLIVALEERNMYMFHF